jgi:hypothetical protein
MSYQIGYTNRFKLLESLNPVKRQLSKSYKLSNWLQDSVQTFGEFEYSETQLSKSYKSSNWLQDSVQTFGELGFVKPLQGLAFSPYLFYF